MYNKQHLIALMEYIGIGLIGGSITHGFFSGIRSLITAIIGILLFIIAEYLKGGQKDYLKLIIGSFIFSIAIGMVSGGFQHFLDSPMRSLWVIPVGWFLSTLIFPYKEGLKDYYLIKSLVLGGTISIGLLGILYALTQILPQSAFSTTGGHHNDEINHQIIIPSIGSTIDTPIIHNTGATFTNQPIHEDNGDHH